MKKFYTILIASFIFLLSSQNVFASDIILIPSKDKLGLKEQFYVDVMLDTKGASINGIEGTINFPEDKLSFVRAEEGKSMITFWIQKPLINKSTISFSGIIPNGFSGVIDPFNSLKKKAGQIIRLVFEAKSGGEIAIKSTPFILAANNGEGTLDKTLEASTHLYISETENMIIYESKDDTPPRLDVSVTQDPNLFGGKYTLLFQATDKETGIESVMIKEGSKNWKNASSPYLLEDQTRHSTISIRATNFSGVSVTSTIESLPYDTSLIIKLILLIVFIFILVFIIKKKYDIKK